MSSPTLHQRYLHTLNDKRSHKCQHLSFSNIAAHADQRKPDRQIYSNPSATWNPCHADFKLPPSLCPCLPLSLSPALRRAKAWCWIRLCSAAPLHPPSPWVVGWCAISFFKIARSVKTCSPSLPPQNSSNLGGMWARCHLDHCDSAGT